MYKKILAPLDGSQLAECTLAHVRAVATGCRVPQVVLLRMIEPWNPQIYDVPDNFRRDTQKKAQAEAEDYLAKVADNLSQGGIATETVAIQGKPAEGILDYVDKNQVDLIVMSTHGRSGVSRWTFGSVTDRVIRQSAVPVLIASPSGCRISK